MGIPVYDTSTGSSITVAGTSLSWSHTCTGSNLYLLVGLWIGNTHSGVSVTYNSVSMTSLGSVTNSNSRTLYLYGLANPATGAHTVSCTWTTSRIGVGSSISFTNVLQTGSVGTFTSTSGTTAASSSLTITTRNSEDVAVDCISSFRLSNTTAPTLTVGGSQTQRQTVTNNSATDSWRQNISTQPGNISSVSNSWTLANQTDFDHVGIALHGIPEAQFFYVL